MASEHPHPQQAHPSHLPPPEGFAARAHVRDMETYRKLYERSVRDPEGYWAEQAERLRWNRKWEKVLEWDFHAAKVAWFAGGRLNASTNCLDRHVEEGRGDRTAFLWEGDDPSQQRGVTYAELLAMVCLRFPWPGIMRTVFGDHERFRETYFTRFPGLYFTGDACRRDEDGDYWITGRVDDVINVSGHRLGTAEVESALVAHAVVAEAAVVGAPHAIKGEALYAFVLLNEGQEASGELRSELVAAVRREIGPFAAPDWIHFAPGLPKTRSGKIMRRILRRIAKGDTTDLGDTSTLADPAVVRRLVATRPG